MPNPFMRSVQRNTSDESMTPDRPHPDAPILETYEGSNHPYRGIETHGVEDNGDPSNPQMEWADGTRKVVYDEDKPSIDPVPVRIVTESKDELRSWRTRQALVQPNNIPTRIIGRNSRRTGLRLKNNNNFFIYVGDNESIASFTGYPLGSFESIDLDIEDEIWSLNPDVALVANIAIIEYLSLPIN
jgi:hypothetical protein